MAPHGTTYLKTRSGFFASSAAGDGALLVPLQGRHGGLSEISGALPDEEGPGFLGGRTVGKDPKGRGEMLWIRPHLQPPISLYFSVGHIPMT